MSYKVKILADSISPDEVRLTTLQATFPRFILAEMNTHRAFSRNSASSRAIPPEKLIAQVEKEPFVPYTFNKRVKGMGVGNPLDFKQNAIAEHNWMKACEASVKAAKALTLLDVDKSRINRLLEPYMWHTAIISATEWDNFFALRNHEDAQPEMQVIARMMHEEMKASTPEEIFADEWHLPLVSSQELVNIGYPEDWFYWAWVSAGRCARVSFDTHENFEQPEVSYDRAKRLESSGHFSPFEHQATPVAANKFYGNFKGWLQGRKTIRYEDNFARIESMV